MQKCMMHRQTTERVRSVLDDPDLKDSALLGVQVDQHPFASTL